MTEAVATGRDGVTRELGMTRTPTRVVALPTALPSLGAAYDTTGAYTLGVEEEFALVDPMTGQLVPRAATVLAVAGAEAGTGSLTPEVVDTVVEGATCVCATASELADELAAQRRRLAIGARAAGCRLVGVGTHPFSSSRQSVTDDPRHRKLADDYPWIIQESATYGVHVHVGVQGADRAIAVCNALRSWLPHLLALSGNSPFWKGEPTGLESTRVALGRLYPRSGVPPVFDDFDHYARTIDALQVAPDVPDHTYAWWLVRPHPRFGTVELRVFDAQTDVRRTAALAALAQALVAWIDDELLVEGMAEFEPSVVCEQNMWAATRSGSAATFIDAHRGHRVIARRAILDLFHVLSPYLAAFGSTGHLLTLHSMLDHSGSAAQRDLLRRHGDLQGVVEALGDATLDHLDE